MAHRITFDGASRGNPGPGSSAAVLWLQSTRVAEAAKVHSKHVTNNEAEYAGLLVGLELALKNGVQKLIVEGDSKLVIEQVFHSWKVKHPRLVPLHQKARELAARFVAVEGRWIPRARNGAADALCNAALDDHRPPQLPFAVTTTEARTAPPARVIPTILKQLGIA
jgi:ribonuclease HI